MRNLQFSVGEKGAIRLWRVLLALFVVFSFASGTSSASVDLIPDSLSMEWTLNTTAKTITITLKTSTTGYVAVGFPSVAGAMISSDVIAGWISNGTVRVVDLWITAKNDQCPGVCEDSLQGGKNDILSFSGNSSNGVTTISFTRLLDTGDSEYDRVIKADPGETQSIIYAFGELGTEQGKLSYHAQNKGQKSVTWVEKSPVYNISAMSGDVQLSWSILPDQETLNFTLKAKTTGWIGFGFPEQFGVMNPSDMIIGYVGTNGEVSIRDYYCNSSRSVSCQAGICLDTSLGGVDDISNASGSESDGWTTLNFHRKIVTADTKIDRSLINSVDNITAINFAIGSSDDIVFHTARTSTSVNFITGPSSSTLSPTPAPTPTAPTPSSSASNYTGSLTTLSGNFQLSWKIVNAEVEFKLLGKTTGWVAVGFSSTAGQMTDSDMIGGWVASNGQGYVRDYYINAKSFGCPGICTDEQLGGKNDVTLVSSSEQNGETTIVFRRNLTTSDQNDKVLSATNSINIIFAIGAQDNFTDIHYAKGAAVITLSSAEVNILETPGFSKKRSHGIIMFVAWGFLIPAGIFVSAFCKTSLGVWWFRIHILIQMIGMVLAIAGFIVSIEFTSELKNTHFNGYHQKIGLVVMILMILQPFLGTIADFLWDQHRKRLPVFPDGIHWLFGYGSFILAMIAIFSGMSRIGTSNVLYILLGIYLGIMALVFVVLTVLRVKHLGKQTDTRKSNTKRISL